MEHPDQGSRDQSVLVDVRGLTKDYGPIRALDAISFQARRGDILGFLGPNGAGKSTAMKIITCFLEADGGEVSVGGFDTRAQSIDVRRMIGYCPESAPAYGEMTVHGFLEFICDARGIEERGPAIERVVDLTGLEGVVHQSIETLSKGYKRRVGLAQALIHDPEVLILDEPTDGLDPNQKALIHELISSLSENKCIILSTHILDEVERICNRALIISEGRILVDSTPGELMEQAPNHNVIRVTLGEKNGDLIDEIESQDWCARVIRESDSAFSVVPDDGRNHLSDLLGVLKEVELQSIHLQEGRLDELFRKITKGVAA